MSSDILVRSEHNVITLTFNRPERKNAITTAMYAVMLDVIERAALDPSVRVVMLQGHESVFSAGNDIGQLSQPPAGEDSPGWRFVYAIAAFPKPLIAAVCGPAVGLGTTMLFHCDLVYAGRNAAFSMPFVKLGLCPEAASSLLAPKILGYHRAAEALLLGEPLDAQTALEVGLINRMLAACDVNAYAQAIAHKLADMPISSLVETKRLMKKGECQIIEEQIREESEVFRRLTREPAAKEAFSAFREKRKPDFSRL